MGCGCGSGAVAVGPASGGGGGVVVSMPMGDRSGVVVRVREQEPRAVSAGLLTRLVGGLEGLAGVALLPRQREALERRHREMAEAMAQSRVEHHRNHANNVRRAGQHRTNAAMCATCPKVSRDGVTCGATGQAVKVMLKVSAMRRGEDGATERESDGATVECPLGRHARGSRHLVRWMGLLWYGVPEPLRWRIDWGLIARFGMRGNASTLAGCGCCVAWKLASRRGVGRVLGVLERVPGWRRRVVPAVAGWWRGARAKAKSDKAKSENGG
jgi:hypothetical protein